MVVKHMDESETRGCYHPAIYRPQLLWNVSAGHFHVKTALIPYFRERSHDFIPWYPTEVRGKVNVILTEVVVDMYEAQTVADFEYGLLLVLQGYECMSRVPADLFIQFISQAQQNICIHSKAADFLRCAVAGTAHVFNAKMQAKAMRFCAKWQQK